MVFLQNEAQSGSMRLMGNSPGFPMVLNQPHMHRVVYEPHMSLICTVSCCWQATALRLHCPKMRLIMRLNEASLALEPKKSNETSSASLRLIWSQPSAAPKCAELFGIVWDCLEFFEWFGIVWHCLNCLELFGCGRTRRYQISRYHFFWIDTDVVILQAWVCY